MNRTSSSDSDNNDPRIETLAHKREKNNMEYIKNNVQPIFNSMMVKIINQEPKDVMGFILSYLRKLKQDRQNQKKMREKPK